MTASGGPSAEQPQLVFDAAFESGNLAEARLVCTNPLEYDLYIRPDTLNERHRIWFFFSARCSRPTKALLHIVGYSKTKSLYRDGMAPVVRSSAASGWQRMPTGSAYLYRSPRHGQKYVLSFPFMFDSPDITYSFAYCYPYTYSYLQRFLHTLDSKNLSCYRRRLLTRTIQARRLDLITISSPANLAVDDMHEREINNRIAEKMAVGAAANKTSRQDLTRAPSMEPSTLDSRSFCGALGSANPSIRSEGTGSVEATLPPLIYLFVSARVHPGETPASFVMHGLLRFLLSDEPAAKAIREVAVIKIVPMLNPDGVFLGNYRVNSVGLDLNRMWAASTPWASPTIDAVRMLAQAYTHRPGCDVRVFLDMHAHSTAMGGFVYANAPNAPRHMEQVATFPRALGNHSRELSFDRTKFCADPSKAGTGRRAMGRMLPTVHCYTLEVSFFCAASGNSRGDVYTPKSYLEMGIACGNALNDIAQVAFQAGNGSLRNPSTPLMTSGGSESNSGKRAGNGGRLLFAAQPALLGFESVSSSLSGNAGARPFNGNGNTRIGTHISGRGPQPPAILRRLSSSENVVPHANERGTGSMGPGTYGVGILSTSAVTFTTSRSQLISFSDGGGQRDGEVRAALAGVTEVGRPAGFSDVMLSRRS